VSNATALITTVSSLSSQITSISDPQFARYGFESNQPHDIIVDSAGNAWISEPGANKIARLSGFTPGFVLNASPSVLSVALGKSGTVGANITSASGYQGSVAFSGNSPIGVSLSFTPGQVNVAPGRSASSQVTVDVAPNAQIGNSSIVLLAGDATTAHSTSMLLIVTNTTTLNTQNKPQCLIATATYGSQLSPEVELLRGYRDVAVKSRVGWSFLLMFNAWYYSFSPMVANYINEHPTARPVMQVALYPLILFLTVAFQLNTALTAFPEAATLLSGLLASGLIGGFYLGLPLGILSRKIHLLRRISAKPGGVLFLSGVVVLVVGELLISPLLMFSASIIVLSTMLLAATLTKTFISK